MAQTGDVSNGDDAQAVAEAQVDGGGDAPPGVGLRVLIVLATPLNYRILNGLRERALRLAELRRATGLPAQTTLRGHLASLVDIGAVEKRPTTEMPYTVENQLTPMGREMLDVAASLESWLERSPAGVVSLGSGNAKGIVKAFVDGWSSSMMRGLGDGPRTLTQLDRGIATLSYPALERRLASMRMAGLVQACESVGIGRPYSVTEWARRGVVPLAAAGRCERRHMRERAAPITRTDVESAFLLTLPLVGLSRRTSGSCQLAVDADPADDREQSGVRVTVKRGRIVACRAEAAPTPDDYATGSAETWLEAVRAGCPERLELGGEVAAGVVNGLHSALARC